MPAVGKITRVADVIESPKKHLQSLIGQVFEHLVMNVIWTNSCVLALDIASVNFNSSIENGLL